MATYIYTYICIVLGFELENMKKALFPPRQKSKTTKNPSQKAIKRGTTLICMWHGNVINTLETVQDWDTTILEELQPYEILKSMPWISIMFHHL